MFRVWFAATAALILWVLWLFGVFEDSSTGVLVIVGLTLGAIAVASFFYWKTLSDDLE